MANTKETQQLSIFNFLYLMAATVEHLFCVSANSTCSSGGVLQQIRAVARHKGEAWQLQLRANQVNHQISASLACWQTTHQTMNESSNIYLSNLRKWKTDSNGRMDLIASICVHVWDFQRAHVLAREIAIAIGLHKPE